MQPSFEELGLRAELVQAVAELGYTTPTSIQVAVAPHLLAGRDVLAQSHTGTGKTAAFALPLLHSLDREASGVQGLVLAPTRELAMQVTRAFTRYGRLLGIQALPVYGGQSYSRQEIRLQRGVHVVVGTPGRILDLIGKGTLKLDSVKFVVLDEADEMLRMGFIDDVEAILAATPVERQTAMFSATIPERVRGLYERYMREPTTVSVTEGVMTVEQVEQRFYLLEDSSRLPALARLLEVEEIRGALIFARTRVGCAELAEALLSRGFTAEALHGDLPQEAREAVLGRFRRGHTALLVATDVAARGLDIPAVSHVFNYDFPLSAQEYVHRIGRTARAGSTGVAISLVLPREQARLNEVTYFTRSPLRRAVMPTVAEVHARRDEGFTKRLESVVAESDLDAARAFVTAHVAGGGDLETLAAAAISLVRAHESHRPDEEVREVFKRPRQPVGATRPSTAGNRRTGATPFNEPRRPAGKNGDAPRGASANSYGDEPGMVRLSIDLGRVHGVRPADVVATISREAKIPGTTIGAISINKTNTTLDVREASVHQVLRRLRQGFTLRGQAARLEAVAETRPRAKARR